MFVDRPTAPVIQKPAATSFAGRGVEISSFSCQLTIDAQGLGTAVSKIGIDRTIDVRQLAIAFSNITECQWYLCGIRAASVVQMAVHGCTETKVVYKHARK
jgi:hypothetical protein